MLITDQQLLFYQRCDRRAFLDIYGDSSQKEAPSDFLMKLMQDSANFQQRVLETQTYQKPDYPARDWSAAAQATLELMQQGVEKIAKGVLAVLPEQLQQVRWLPPAPNITLVSYPDLLVKQPGYSNFGDWIYVPTDIRLGKRPKLDYQMVVAFHAQVLALVQGSQPDVSWLILREKGAYGVNLSQRIDQMRQILADYIEMLQSQQEPEVFIARQKCSLCQWHQSCYQVAQSQHHLSLLPGVTPSRYLCLQELNLLSVEALAQITPDVLEPYPEFSDGSGLQVIQQAQAVWHNQAVLRWSVRRTMAATITETDPATRIDAANGSTVQPGSIVANYVSSRDSNIHKNGQNSPSIHGTTLQDILYQAPVELYFDIEAQPELHLDYLHGVLVVDKRSNTQEFYGFLAESPESELIAWQQFLELVWAYPIAPIYHFCDYELKTIQRLAKTYQTPRYLWQPLIKRLVDIHQKVTQTVTLPVESYALKPIARWMGFEWRNANANGAQCVYWYEQWLKTGDRTVLETILRYNEDDCRATHHVKDWLANFLDQA
ncbi:MAG: TM0106 family RecB-like putative nuclease [Oscillatoriales cyanobacterium RM2_1_1]|nr:TM0106 family RecB-like putative nuclease [Oscillatoriales cyanobacterium SM2_3_0]NJO46820.1 TM0106 family RecB-like putative nuclease [Oscillatoriales cyanobacterium RM2_1_1]